MTASSPSLNHLNPKKKFGRKIPLTIAVSLFILGAGYVTYQKMTSTNEPNGFVEWTTIKRGDVTETVSASGAVQATNQLTLNLPGGGGDRITSINVKVGDHVTKGQVLATIDDKSANTGLENAKANLISAQAHLSQLMKGATPEDIAMQRANMNKAKAELDNAKNDFEVQKAQFQVQKLRSNLDNAKSTFDSKNMLYSQNAVSKSDLDTAKNNLDQAQSDYNSALTQLDETKSQSKSALNQAQAAYDAAVAQFNLTTAPPTQENIDVAQAAVTSARSQLEQQQINVDKLTLKAPMDGIIIAVNGDVGMIPSNTPPLIVMNNSDGESLQVIAQISQSDIAKIKEGMPAKLETSSYEGKSFQGTVALVYPEATTQSGVTTYNVLIRINNEEKLLKSGMTVDITIEAGTHKNVLYVPSAALKAVNGRSGIYTPVAANSGDKNGKRKNNSAVQNGLEFHPVKIGYFGDDKVEIISNLKEGQQIAEVLDNTSNKKAPTGINAIPGLGGAKR